jgi:type IV secretion system protein VirB8
MSRELDRRPIPQLVPADDFAHRRLALERKVELEVAEDRAREAEAGKKRAWIFASLLIIVCAAQAAAIAIMLPLKDVVPYTIMVDRQTGYVEVMRGIETANLREDEALVHSMLAQYVLERETFDPADFKKRYERVALWSAGDARSDFVALYQPGAPGSMLDEMRAGVIVRTTVKQVTLIDGQFASVRFSRTRDAPGMEPVSSEWSALVGYRFTGAPMRMADRLINPLGFQVVHYRPDGEGAPASPAQPAEVAELDEGASPTGDFDTGVYGRPGAEPMDASGMLVNTAPSATRVVAQPSARPSARPGDAAQRVKRSNDATKTSQQRRPEVSGPVE